MKLTSLYNLSLFRRSIDTNIQKETMDSVKKRTTKNWNFSKMEEGSFLARI